VAGSSDIYIRNVTLIGNSLQADFAKFQLPKETRDSDFYNRDGACWRCDVDPKEVHRLGGGILDP